MKFEIYCDESRTEALINKAAHKFCGIGGIWIPANKRTELKEGINKIKDKHGINGEVKWSKVSPKSLECYKEIIEFFFRSSYIRFRVLVVESSKADKVHFHGSDAELEFYKFYYQLIHHWVLDFNEYDIFVDLKTNRVQNRLGELRKVLDNANLTSIINQVQGLPSNQSIGIQVADLFTGLCLARFNGQTASKSKLEFIDFFERRLGKPISHTPKWEEKVNVFKIKLRGGW